MCPRSSPVAASISSDQRAVPHVQPKGPRCVGHLRHVVPAQPVAQIVLGQQHLGDAREHLGLVLGHPHQLRRAVKPGIARLPVIRRECGTTASSAVHSAPERPSFQRMAGRSTAPRASSSVAPVLLAGKADRPNGGERRAVPGLQFVHGPAGGDPPVFGILLRPQSPWRRDAERSAEPTERRCGHRRRAGPPSPPRCRGRCRDTTDSPPCPGAATRRRLFRLVLRLRSSRLPLPTPVKRLAAIASPAAVRTARPIDASVSVPWSDADRSFPTGAHSMRPRRMSNEVMPRCSNCGPYPVAGTGDSIRRRSVPHLCAKTTATERSSAISNSIPRAFVRTVIVDPAKVAPNAPIGNTESAKRSSMHSNRGGTDGATSSGHTVQSLRSLRPDQYRLPDGQLDSSVLRTCRSRVRPGSALLRRDRRISRHAANHRRFHVHARTGARAGCTHG